MHVEKLHFNYSDHHSDVVLDAVGHKGFNIKK